MLSCFSLQVLTHFAIKSYFSIVENVKSNIFTRIKIILKHVYSYHFKEIIMVNILESVIVGFPPVYILNTSCVYILI